ncbi:hypothetical protein CAOG_009899 [Capsaspora owczarzaki ATCC 30864]|uniref:Mediator complex subunit 22 n=2 Tax=Capsaspora owczarzaki (strain ATCC 30864) TaxID=595528 RepID=A0A0D2VV09_CAPO3|nr:hypothetical protein CAOG_009899 [Capsaspora owczarzaki ATCC 30864]
MSSTRTKAEIKLVQLAKLEAKLKGSLDESVRQITESFMAIVRNAKVQADANMADTTIVIKDEFELQLRTTSMIRGYETLLRMIAELKDTLLLNDFEKLNATVAEKVLDYRQREMHLDAATALWRDECRIALGQLEDVYFSSRFRFTEA